MAIVERGTGVVHFIAPDGSERMPAARPLAPELDWINRLPAGRSNVFSDAAEGPDGSLLLRVSHYHLSDGALVIKVGQDGNVLGSERFVLPVSSELKTPDNPEGYQIPVLMDVAGRQLYFVSAAGKVTYYQLQ